MLTLTQPLYRVARFRRAAHAIASPSPALTWEQFTDRVARLAGGLRARGLEPGDRVAILAENSAAYLQLYLAVPWAGLVMVPLNTRWAQRELIDAVRDCGAKTLIADESFLTLAQSVGEQVECVRDVIRASSGRIDALSQAEPVADAALADDETAALFYTGGTTGRSKGVMLTPRGLMVTTLQVVQGAGLHEGAVVLQSAPLYHMAAGGVLYATLMAGAASVVLPRFEPVAVMKAIQDGRVTHALLVPTMLEMVLSHPEFGRYEMGSLERIIYGASPMPEALLRRAMARLPSVRFTQFYGMTELSPVATCLHPDDHVLEGDAARRLRSAGRALPLCDVRIVDGADGELSAGEIGEIVVRGPGVMKGYWGMPEATAAALRGGFMHTGDAGYIDEDGYLFIVDRVKDMIISGGENVYSTEVENAVYAHASVQECAVVGLPDDKWGEIVCAVVYPVPGSTLAERDLLAHCESRIARYKCPKRIVLVDEPLPKTGAGKIQKTEIRKQLRA
ncbi:MAG: long-chain-fatty-acid--CoA ligase [Sinimarinibacterium flocculans]|uniref:long-chain-fatty-acid--CoA ligase n=1 Tax=Sinimarinibacterium flocculans TaxID=985250 RepID=UPI003C69F391